MFPICVRGDRSCAIILRWPFAKFLHVLSSPSGWSPTLSTPFPVLVCQFSILHKCFGSPQSFSNYKPLRSDTKAPIWKLRRAMISSDTNWENKRREPRNSQPLELLFKLSGMVFYCFLQTLKNHSKPLQLLKTNDNRISRTHQNFAYFCGMSDSPGLDCCNILH